MIKKSNELKTNILLHVGRKIIIKQCAHSGHGLDNNNCYALQSLPHIIRLNNNVKNIYMFLGQ